MSDVDEEPAPEPSKQRERPDGVRPAAQPAETPREADEPQTLGPRIFLGAFALAGLGALGIYLALRPSGEPLGEVDLLGSAHTLVIDGSAGDRVTFVSSVTTSLRAYEGSSWKSRSNDATRAMKASTLTVVVVGPDGSEQTSRCPFWGGSMSSDRPDDEHLTENGVINDCVVSLRSSGKQTVRGSVQWEKTLAVEAARLTVHRHAE